MKWKATLALLLFVFPLAAFAKGKGSSPESLLRSLYAAHQPWAHKDAFEDDASLPKYFDDNLVKLILADRHCDANDWGVGNLDFDPFLAAQDFGDNGIGDLKFRRLADKSAERWEVSFELFPQISKKRTTLVYRFSKNSSGVWRIADIDYGDSTLLHVLAPPCE